MPKPPKPTPTASPTPTPQPTPTPSPGFVNGIDVSYHQGSIDWGRVAGAGKTFTFVRASAGTLTSDPAYTTNRAGARAAGPEGRLLPLRKPRLRGERRHQRGPLVPAERDGRVGRPRAGPRSRGVERSGCSRAHDLGPDLADRGRVGHRSPPGDLHDAELLVGLHGQHRLVRPERVSRLGRTLDDRVAANRPGRPTGAATAGRSGSTRRPGACRGSADRSTWIGSTGARCPHPCSCPRDPRRRTAATRRGRPSARGCRDPRTRCPSRRRGP